MKIVCNVCGKMGYLQHLSKNYYRVRRYGGLNPITQKPRFEITSKILHIKFSRNRLTTMKLLALT
jgi:hypothetical protein